MTLNFKLSHYPIVGSVLIMRCWTVNQGSYPPDQLTLRTLPNCGSGKSHRPGIALRPPATPPAGATEPRPLPTIVAWGPGQRNGLADVLALRHCSAEARGQVGPPGWTWTMAPLHEMDVPGRSQPRRCHVRMSSAWCSSTVSLRFHRYHRPEPGPPMASLPSFYRNHQANSIVFDLKITCCALCHRVSVIVHLCSKSRLILLSPVCIDELCANRCHRSSMLLQIVCYLQ